MRQVERKSLGKCRVFWRMAVVLALAVMMVSGTALAAPLVPGVPSGQANAYERPAMLAAPEGPPQAGAAERPAISIQLTAICNKDGSLNQTAELALILNLPAGETFAALNTALWFNPAIMTPITFACQPQADGSYTPDLTLGASPINVPGLMNQNLNTLDARADESGKLVFTAKAGVPTDFPVDTDTTGPITLAVIRFALVGTGKFSFSAAEPQKLLYAGNPTDITSFIKFQDDATAAASIVNAAATYTSGKTSFYHVPLYDKENPGTWADVAVPGVTPEIKIPRPNTVGRTVLAVDSTKPITEATRYSYLTNHIPDVSIPALITGGSFDGKLDPDEFCAVSFRDWSGEELGTLILPMYMDVRQRVQDYVAQWVHTDLRVRADYASLARTDTYRGIYPHSGPNGTDTAPEGVDFPLTNKLDYAFLTQKMVKSANGTKWEVDVADPDAMLYPFTYGWMADAPGTETWSTMGVGELADYVVADGSLPISGKNTYVDFIDFERLENRSEIAHATYRPGAKLAIGDNYTPVGEPCTLYHTRYGYEPSVGSGTYVTQYKYARVNVAGWGVSRPRSIALNTNFVPDVSGKPQPPFPQKVIVENGDFVDVEIIQSGTIMSLTYNLVDEYGRNFVVGTAYSPVGNEANIPTNFNYTDFTYASRLGTDGLVFRATWNAVQEAGNAALLGDKTEYDSALSRYETLNDLNLRKDIGGGLYTSTDAFKTLHLSALGLADLANDGQKDGDGTLTWHQLQYYLLHPEAGLLTDEAAKAAETYGWCRLLDGCTMGESIETWEQLITAAATGDITKLDTFTLPQASDVFYLRETEAGAPFTDLNGLKRKLISAVTTATGSLTDLTWDQIQYYLVHADDVTPPVLPAPGAVGESNEKFWWKNGGKKVTDWNTLIAAAKTAQGGIYAPLNTIAYTAVGGDPYYLRADLNGTPFADQTAMIEALKKAVDAGANTWEEVQQRIIGSGTPDDNYWWGYGGVNLAASEADTVEADLVRAAGLANQGHPASLNTLTLDMVTGKPFYFRETFDGVHFSDLDVAKAKIKAAVIAGAAAWEQLQYYFAHNGAAETENSSGESDFKNQFYWWKDGGVGLPVAFGPDEYASFAEAAYRKVRNGNDNAWNILTKDNVKNLTSKSYFVKENNLLAPKFDDLPKFESESDLAQFTAALEQMAKDDTETPINVLPTEEPPVGGVPAYLLWCKMQYYLLSYPTIPTPPDPPVPPTTDVPGKYWWRVLPKNPNVVEKTALDLLLDDMLAYKNGLAPPGAEGTLTEAEFNAKINIDRLNGQAAGVPLVDGLTFRRDTVPNTFGGFQLNAARTSLRNLAKGTAVTNGKLELSWYQVQYYLIVKSFTGYPTDGTNPNYAWAPKWAQDKYGKPGEPAL